jgi:hypothetical protein
VKTSPPTLATKEMALASRKRTIIIREFFYQNQHDCGPSPILLASLGPLRSFSVSPTEDTAILDTTEVIETESQAVPNTQDAFKHGGSAGYGVYAPKRTTSKVV